MHITRVTHNMKPRVALAVVAVIGSMMLASQAHAQTVYTWAGGASGNFSDAAKWSSGTAPPVDSGLNTLSFLSTTTGGTASSATFTNNLSSGTFGRINFGTAWGTTTATISGSAFTLLGVSGTGIDTGATNVGARTISPSITIGNSQTWRHSGGFSNALTANSLALGANTLTLIGVTQDRFVIGQSSFTQSAGAKLVFGASSYVDINGNVLNTNIPIDLMGGGYARIQGGSSYAGLLTSGSGSTNLIQWAPASTLAMSGTLNGSTVGGTSSFGVAAGQYFGMVNFTGLISGTLNNFQIGDLNSSNVQGTIRISNANNSFASTSPRMRAGSLVLAADDPANGSSNGALGTGTGTLQLGTNTDNASYFYSVVGEGSRTLNRNITISATSTASGVWARLGQLGSGTSTFGGGVTINRSGLLLSSGTSGSGRANFTGALTGANGITVVGNGIVGLSSTSSSFSGTATVRSGVLVVGTSAPAAGNGALGNASSAIRLGDTTIASGSVKAATTSSITVTGSLSASDSNFGGATLVNGDRVIVWRQTTAGQNGIYTWNSSNGLLTLAESGSAAGVYGSQYLVTSGSFANQRFWINTSNATTTGFVPDDIANPNVSLLVSAPVTIGRAIQVVSNSSSGVSAIGGSLTSGTATFTGNVALDRGVTLQAATGGTVVFQTGAWTTNGNLITAGSAGNAGTVRIENAIGGAGGLTLNNGLLELLGANTYTGATTVNAGRLLVTGQLGNTAVTVNSGGLLGGSGSIGGAVTIAGGTLSPGSSPGQISIASLVLQPSSTVFMEMTGTTAVTQYDRINLTGGLTYDGTLQLDLSGTFADNTTFNLFSGFTSASGNLAGIVSSGSFYNGLAFTRTDNLWKSTAAPNGQTLEFNQTTGNLVIVPEPGAIALAAIGIAAAAWSLRRRKA